MLVVSGGEAPFEAAAIWASLIAGKASSESLVNQSFQSTLDRALVTWDVDGTEKGINDVMVELSAEDGGCLIILLDDVDEDEEDRAVKKEKGFMLALDTVI